MAAWNPQAAEAASVISDLSDRRRKAAFDILYNPNPPNAPAARIEGKFVLPPTTRPRTHRPPAGVQVPPPAPAPAPARASAPAHTVTASPRRPGAGKAPDEEDPMAAAGGAGGDGGAGGFAGGLAYGDEGDEDGDEEGGDDEEGDGDESDGGLDQPAFEESDDEDEEDSEDDGPSPEAENEMKQFFLGQLYLLQARGVKLARNDYSMDDTLRTLQDAYYTVTYAQEADLFVKGKKTELRMVNSFVQAGDEMVGPFMKGTRRERDARFEKLLEEQTDTLYRMYARHRRGTSNPQADLYKALALFYATELVQPLVTHIRNKRARGAAVPAPPAPAPAAGGPAFASAPAGASMHVPMRIPRLPRPSAA